jgi:DNA invertase Pin-like site-specific DNA recombinase
VFLILDVAAAKAVSVYIAKEHLVLDGSLQATMTATILRLRAQDEREFITARTKEALARRQAQGLPEGPAARVKLHKHKDQIVAHLQNGIWKRSIARILECLPSTLDAWFKRQRITLRRA